MSTPDIRLMPTSAAWTSRRPNVDELAWAACVAKSDPGQPASTSSVKTHNAVKTRAPGTPSITPATMIRGEYRLSINEPKPSPLAAEVTLTDNQADKSTRDTPAANRPRRAIQHPAAMAPMMTSGWATTALRQGAGKAA